MLSATETRHLEDMERDQCLQHLRGLSTVFAGPLVQQRIWPLYFETKEAAGKAMQNGYKDLWSTFIIAVSSSSEIRRVAAVRFLHLSWKILIRRFKAKT